MTISKKQIEVKKDQIDKPKIKSQRIKFKREPNPQTRSEPRAAQLSESKSKSPNIVDKKIKVNAGKDIEWLMAHWLNYAGHFHAIPIPSK